MDKRPHEHRPHDLDQNKKRQSGRTGKFPLKIAILGWGSLISDPHGLPTQGQWQLNGPQLPIEFSRISNDSRLTLVIDAEHGETFTTRYIQSSRSDLGDAICDLRCREKTFRKRIGFIDLRHETSSAKEFPEHEAASAAIYAWLEPSGFDAVIWTALPSNFQEKRNEAFSPEAAVRYLDSLSNSEQINAFKYINGAPIEVSTPLRTLLSELGKLQREGKQ